MIFPGNKVFFLYIPLSSRHPGLLSVLPDVPLDTSLFLTCILLSLPGELFSPTPQPPHLPSTWFPSAHPARLSWNTSSQTGLHWLPAKWILLITPQTFLLIPHHTCDCCFISSQPQAVGAQRYGGTLCNPPLQRVGSRFSLLSCNRPSAPSRAPWTYRHLLNGVCGTNPAKSMHWAPLAF